jgi:hypothetical protein
MNYPHIDDRSSGFFLEVPEELAAAVVDARLEMPPPPPSASAPELDVYGDNALDSEF